MYMCASLVSYVEFSSVALRLVRYVLAVIQAYANYAFNVFFLQ